MYPTNPESLPGFASRRQRRRLRAAGVSGPLRFLIPQSSLTSSQLAGHRQRLPLKDGVVVVDVVNAFAQEAVDNGRATPCHQAQIRIRDPATMARRILRIDPQRLW